MKVYYLHGMPAQLHPLKYRIKHCKIKSLQGIASPLGNPKDSSRASKTLSRSADRGNGFGSNEYGKLLLQPRDIRKIAAYGLIELKIYWIDSLVESGRLLAGQA